MSNTRSKRRREIFEEDYEEEEEQMFEEAVTASLDSYALQLQIDEIIALSNADYAFELQIQESISASENSNLVNHDRQIEQENGSNDNFTKCEEVDRKGKYVQNPTKKARITVKEVKDEFTQPSVYETCGICLENKNAVEFFFGVACTHRYCTECIALHVQSKVSEKLLPIMCPEPKCKQQLIVEQCQEAIPRETMQKWSEALAESIIPDFQKFYCPYKDCSALLQNDNAHEVGSSSANNVVTQSECPLCRRLFCASCKVPWHEGLDCSELEALPSSEKEKDDIMLFKLAKEKQWKRCTNCRRLIERIEGCAHISCRCGFQFCYHCGSEWKDHDIPCRCGGWRE